MISYFATRASISEWHILLKNSPNYRTGVFKSGVVADIVFVEKCRMISQVPNMDDTLSITTIVAPSRQQN